MSDVMAVADRVVVLRLGRNNGIFRVSETTNQEIIAAITGATTNAVSARAARKASQEEHVSTPETPTPAPDRPTDRHPTPTAP